MWMDCRKTMKISVRVVSAQFQILLNEKQHTWFVLLTYAFQYLGVCPKLDRKGVPAEHTTVTKVFYECD
jgi:hypothetical protein